MFDYWWYNLGLYMTDTFWPYVLGEGGYIGLTMYLLSIIFLTKWIYKNLKHKIKNIKFNSSMESPELYQTGLSVFIIMLLNSLASGILNNTFSVFLCLLIVGLIINPLSNNIISHKSLS